MMKVQTQSIISAFVLAMLTFGINAFAQETAPQDKSQPKRDVIIERRNVEVTVQGPEGSLPLPLGMDSAKLPGDQTFVYVASEMSFGGKVVKGAPYSAQAVTENIQTLSDGNRIVHKNTAALYRDGEGRTRHEQTLNAIGPWASAGDPPQMIFINDPVAGVNYVLDPRTHTANKIVLPHFNGKPGETPAADEMKRLGTGSMRVQTEVLAAPPPPEAGPGIRFYSNSASPEDVKKESLGKQTIEGVTAEGTRITMTIPAGKIGNEQPIQIVTETWYSPELQTVVLSKHSDPRMGENVFRLTSINRNEPAHALFEVPADYTIKEGPQPLIRSFRMKKPATNQ